MVGTLHLLVIGFGSEVRLPGPVADRRRDHVDREQAKAKALA